MSAGTTPFVGGDAGDLAAAVLDADDLGRALEHRAAALRAAGEGHDDARGLGQAVGLGVKPAQDPVGVQQRVQLGAFLRVDDPALDAPRGRPALSAMQFGEPLPRWSRPRGRLPG